MDKTIIAQTFWNILLRYFITYFTISTALLFTALYFTSSDKSQVFKIFNILMFTGFAFISASFLSFLSALLSRISKIDLFNNKIILHRRYSKNQDEILFNDISKTKIRYSKFCSRMVIHLKNSKRYSFCNIGFSKEDWTYLITRLAK